MLRVARNSFFGRSPDGMLEPSWTGTPMQSPHPEGSFQASLCARFLMQVLSMLAWCIYNRGCE